MLTGKELLYYNRHILLDNIGEKGQLALKKSSVLVVGAGGLGCPVLSYLCGAGVGKIGIVDGDNVSTGNLHRQLLFGHRHIGMAKTDAAIEQLSDINPFIRLRGYKTNLTASNALDIFEDYNIIVDATDNFPARYLINDACVICAKPWVFASVDRFQGQLSVFNYKGGPTYRCLFPRPPLPETAPSCSEVGVLGVLPGIMGSLQANEVIKMIIGNGEIMTGKMMMTDSRRNVFYTVQIQKRKKSASEVLDIRAGVADETYFHFCQNQTEGSLEMSVIQVKQILSRNEKARFIDIRNNADTETIENAIKVPLSQITDTMDTLNTENPVIVFCDKGVDSLKAVAKLKNRGWKNVYSLTGGWRAWNNFHIEHEVQ